MYWNWSVIAIAAGAALLVFVLMQLRKKKAAKAKHECNEALNRAQDKILEVGNAARELRIEPDANLVHALHFVGDALTAYSIGDYRRATEAANDATELASAAYELLDTDSLS